MAKKLISTEEVKKNPMIYLKLRNATPEIDKAARCFWHYGTGDGQYVAMKRLYGNAKEVLAYMRSDFKKVRHDLEMEEEIEYVENPHANASMHEGRFYACIVLQECHIDFEAYPESEVIDLTSDKEESV